MTLAHGWMGDQYFFRDYLPLAVLCKSKNIDLKQEFKRFEGSYCYEHLCEDMEQRESSWQEITKEIVDQKSAYKKIFEIIRGSFLWWTFEQTTYWSPYKDLEILKFDYTTSGNNVNGWNVVLNTGRTDTAPDITNPFDHYAVRVKILVDTTPIEA